MTTLSDLPFVTPEDIAERAMEAVRGGRQITAYLNSLDEYARARLSGRLGQEEVNRVWHGSLDPAIGWASWARAGDSYRPGMDFRRELRLTLAQAEAMAGWPIYRAAILQAALEPILYADGPDTQWSPDTIEAVAELVSRPSATCQYCGHGHDPELQDKSPERHECAECEDRAQTGQYAPCAYGGR